MQRAESKKEHAPSEDMKTRLCGERIQVFLVLLCSANTVLLCFYKMKVCGILMVSIFSNTTFLNEDRYIVLLDTMLLLLLLLLLSCFSRVRLCVTP